MKQLELTPRLQTVADLVPEGARLADIGTDHAYLPVWLLMQGRLKHAIAADIRSGPLDRARATAAEYGCTQQVQFVLCNGLADIGPDDVDTVVIAGMGGETIAAIMQAAGWLKSGSYHLLLQPMSAQEQLRGWLWRNGFVIEEERLVREGEKLYNIFSVRPGSTQPMTLGQEWVGCQDKEMVQPLRSEYLNRVLAKLERAISGVRQGAGEDNAVKLAELERVCSAVADMKREWDTWQV